MQAALRKDILSCLTDIGKVIARESKFSKGNRDQHFQAVFNFNETQIARIIDIAIEDMPLSLYLNKNQKVKEAVSPLIAEKLAMFLFREDPQSEYFDNDLLNFKDEITDFVTNDIYVK